MDLKELKLPMNDVFKKFLIFAFISILLIWFGISFLRSIYNISKLNTEIKLLFLSNEELKILSYGESYNFCNFIKENIKSKKNNIFLSSDNKTFYVCRYAVYPIELYYAKNPKEIKLLKKNDEKYSIFIYKNLNKLLNENNSEKWNIENFKSIKPYKDNFGGAGGLYKE